MTLDEYREIWQDQEPREDLRPFEEEVLSEVKERSREYDRKLFWRDLREIGVAVLAAAFFGYVAFAAGAPLMRIGAAVVVAAAAFVVWKLRRARRNGDAELASRPVAERLRARIDQVERQIRLLESVLWWYLAPLGIGVALMMISDGWGLWTAGELLLLVIVYGYIWHLNQRAVRRCHRPRRQELARLLRRLEEEPDAPSPGR